MPSESHVPATPPRSSTFMWHDHYYQDAEELHAEQSSQIIPPERISDADDVVDPPTFLEKTKPRQYGKRAAEERRRHERAQARFRKRVETKASSSRQPSLLHHQNEPLPVLQDVPAMGSPTQATSTPSTSRSKKRHYSDTKRPKGAGAGSSSSRGQLPGLDLSTVGSSSGAGTVPSSGSSSGSEGRQPSPTKRHQPMIPGDAESNRSTDPDLPSGSRDRKGKGRMPGGG